MSAPVFFEDVDDDIREEAQTVARQLPSDLEPHEKLLDVIAEQTALRNLVLALGERLVRDLAAGRHPIYVAAEDEVSPAEAARLLGVSRQYVDRLLAAGRLSCRRKPGSTHRTIRVAEIEAYSKDRVRRRTAADNAIEQLLDGGLDY